MAKKDTHTSNAHSADPCAEFGPTQRWALVWCIVTVTIGITLTVQLSQLDRKNYDTNGEFLDYNAYRENRNASTSIRSELIDERKPGDFVTAVQKMVAERR